MHFRNFLKKFFEIFQKVSTPHEKNLGNAHGGTRMENWVISPETEKVL